MEDEVDAAAHCGLLRHATERDGLRKNRNLGALYDATDGDSGPVFLAHIL